MHNKPVFLRAISLALLCVMCVLPLASCGDSDIPSGMAEVSPATSTFRMFVPKSWYDNSESGIASAYFSSTDKSNVSLTVMSQVTADEYFEDLGSFCEYTVETLEKTLPGYRTLLPEAVGSSAVDSSATAETGSGAISPFTDTKMAGINAKSFEYTAVIDGKDYHFGQVIALRKQEFYVFTYTAEESQFAVHLEDVQSILDNIRFR